jgi:hypothetical protein
MNLFSKILLLIKLKRQRKLLRIKETPFESIIVPRLLRICRECIAWKDREGTLSYMVTIIDTLQKGGEIGLAAELAEVVQLHHRANYRDAEAKFKPISKRILSVYKEKKKNVQEKITREAVGF